MTNSGLRELIVWISVFLTTAQAQQLPAQPPSQPPPLVLRATTRLVQVSVVVQRKGQPVTDLKQDDFILTDNGKRQKIGAFAMETSSPLPVSAEKLPPNTFTNRITQQAGTPSSVTTVMLDLLNTERTDQVYVKREFAKFLRTIRPEDHIGIYALTSRLMVLHDFAKDSSDLVARLVSYKGDDLPNLGADRKAMDGDILMLDAMLRGSGMSGAERDFWTVNRVKGTLSAIEFVANHLAALPGRKNLIWISGGFPLDIGFENMRASQDPSRSQQTFTDEVEKCVRAVNNANLAIYPVDARGLLVDKSFGADRPGGGPSRPGRPGQVRPMVGVKNQDTMRELAERTGGRAYYNRNDLENAIRSAVNDTRVTYMLGYYPEEEKFDGKFHKINVKVDRGGLDVRFRKGYFDMPEQPQDQQAGKRVLRNAVHSPLDAGELGLTAVVQPGDLMHLNSYQVMVRVDAAGIGLQRDNDRWDGKLEILFVQKDDSGNELGGRDDSMELRLQQPTYERIMREGFVYRQNVERNLKATQLRLLVRDAASGSIGSVTVRFDQLVRQ